MLNLFSVNKQTEGDAAIVTENPVKIITGRISFSLNLNGMV